MQIKRLESKTNGNYESVQIPENYQFATVALKISIRI